MLWHKATRGHCGPAVVLTNTYLALLKSACWAGRKFHWKLNGVRCGARRRWSRGCCCWWWGGEGDLSKSIVSSELLQGIGSLDVDLIWRYRQDRRSRASGQTRLTVITLIPPSTETTKTNNGLLSHVYEAADEGCVMSFNWAWSS